MKIIIKENKLEQIIINFLNEYMSDNVVSYVDSFIVVYNENMESDDVEGEPLVLFEYDFYDGRLYVNGYWLDGFMNMFGLNKDESYKIIDKWFENKFDVEVIPESR
jgi:hypothetical protein